MRIRPLPGPDGSLQDPDLPAVVKARPTRCSDIVGLLFHKPDG